MQLGEISTRPNWNLTENGEGIYATLVYEVVNVFNLHGLHRLYV